MRITFGDWKLAIVTVIANYYRDQIQEYINKSV